MPSRHPIRTTTGVIAGRQDRALAKHLDALRTGTSLELANVQAIEAIEAEKVFALQGVGKSALSAVADVAAHRRVYAEHDPTAVGYLTHVTDKISMAIGERVERASRRLG
jgi:hypothetical protein